MQKWTISNPKYESDLLNDALRVSPWCGHRDFIYDYLKYIKPENIIELGTHYGCSFFAMCQSLKDHHLNTKLYAVDTWKGDEQAGFYGNEVWNIVNTTKERYFTEQNTIFMRMYFNEALKKFSNETFDLIHIDGLHTYEAVSEDFRNWLPKLKPDGVILFHDIYSEKKYGTNLFWEELKQKYKYHFEFTHSWGLGILFPKGNLIYKKLLQYNFPDKLLIYQFRSMYRYETYKTTDLTQMANERYEAIQQQSRMIDERDTVIKAQVALVDEKDAAIRNQTTLINEKDEAVRQQSAIIDERDAVIQSQTVLIDEKDAAIKQQSAMIDERDAVIQSQTVLIDEKDAAIKQQSAMIDERDAVIRSQTSLIDEKDAAIKQQSSMINERDMVIKDQTVLIDEKDAAIKHQSTMIDERDTVIKNQQFLISRHEEKIDHLESLLQRVYKHKILSKIIFYGKVQNRL